MADRLAYTLVASTPVLGVPFELLVLEYRPTVITSTDVPELRLVAKVDGLEAGRVAVPAMPIHQAAPIFDSVGALLVCTLNALSAALQQTAIGNLKKIAAGEEPPP